MDIAWQVSRTQIGGKVMVLEYKELIKHNKNRKKMFHKYANVFENLVSSRTYTSAYTRKLNNSI